MTWHGPCPDGLEVDHINYVRNDNRPENLRYVTREQNLADRRWKMGEFCNSGHPLSGDNLYIRPSSGRRTCKTCTRQYVRPPTGLVCSGDNCGRPADYLVRSPNPVCEMHYQRLRKEAKKQRMLARRNRQRAA